MPGLALNNEDWEDITDQYAKPVSATINEDGWEDITESYVGGQRLMGDETQFTPPQPRDKNFLERVKNSWDIGRSQFSLGHLRYQQLTGDATPDLESHIQHIKSNIPSNDDIKERGLPEKAIRAAAEMLPTQLGALKSGIKRGLVMGTGAAGITAVAGQAGPQVLAPEEIITVPSAFSGMYAVGAISGAVEDIGKVEAGLAYDELLDLKDDKGQGIDPTIAKAAAGSVGVINGLIELAQIKLLLKTIPGGEALLRGAIRKTVKKAVTSGTLKGVALKYSGKYAGFIAAETAQEIAQESTNILAGRLATEFSNELKGTDIPQATKDEIVKRLTDTAKQSALAFTVMGLPGTTVSAGVEAGKRRVEPTGALEQADEQRLLNQVERDYRDGNITAEQIGEIKAKMPDIAADLDQIVSDNLIDDIIEAKETQDPEAREAKREQIKAKKKSVVRSSLRRAQEEAREPRVIKSALKPTEEAQAAPGEEIREKAEPKVEVPDFKTTTEAVAFSKIATPEQLERVKVLRDEHTQKGDKLRATGNLQDIQEALKEDAKSQFMREVLEAKEDPERFDVAKKPIERVHPLPIRPLNERWEIDPGAIPGEPIMWLDGTGDDAKAAIIEEADDQGNVLYNAIEKGGQSFGVFPTVEQAGKAAEEGVTKEPTNFKAFVESKGIKWSQVSGEGKDEALLEKMRTEFKGEKAVEKPTIKMGDKVIYNGEEWEVGFVNQKTFKGTLRLQKSGRADAKQVNRVDPKDVELIKPVSEKVIALKKPAKAELSQSQVKQMLNEFYQRNKDTYEAKSDFFDQAPETMAMELENDFATYDKYLGKFPEETDLGEIIKAYQAGELPAAEQKVKAKEPPKKETARKKVAKKPAVKVADKDTKKAKRFRTLADNLQKQINDKRREMTQNPTPKRMREYYGRLHDADNLERTQGALRALADSIERGTLPEALKDIKSKKDIEPLVRKGLESSGGYYDVIPSDKYSNTSEQGKALQELLEGTATEEQLAEKEERERKEKITKLEEDVRFSKIPGFFPTPKATIDQMLELADIQPEMSVLEPSAGKGDIADAIREKGIDPDVIETVPSLVNILEAKEHNVVGNDFLEHTGQYDRIIQNPPFEKGQDIDHVRHAYGQLKPGGRLVSIMSPGPFFRSDKKAKAFREWFVSIYGTEYDLGQAFKGVKSFRQTGVSSKVVVVDKPTVSREEKIEDAKTRIIERIKDQRGSISFDKATGTPLYDDLVTVGKHYYSQGHKSFAAFSKQMKSTLGNAWAKVRKIMKWIWQDVKARLKDEAGAIKVGKGTEDFKVDEYIKGALKGVTGKPKIKKEMETSRENAVLQQRTGNEPTFSDGSTMGEDDSSSRQAFEYLQWHLQDRLNALARAQRAIEAEKGVPIVDEANAYQVEEGMHGKATANVQDFNLDMVEPLLDKIHESNLSLEDVEEFLMARHAPEANEYLKKLNPEREGNDWLSGMKNEDALDIIDKYKGNKDIREIAKMVDAITSETRKVLKQSGLVDTETIDNWEKAYKYYVPLKRAHKPDALPKRGRGMDIRGKEVHPRLAGSHAPAKNILTNLIAQHEAALIRAEKAKVGRALLELAQDNPNKNFWKVDTEEHKPYLKKRKEVDPLTGQTYILNEVTFGRDPLFRFADNVLIVKDAEAKEHTISFNVENVHAIRIASAMKNLGAGNTHAVVNIAASINRFLAFVNTSGSPEFIFSNFFRDIQTAGYNISDTQGKNLRGKMLKDVFKALQGIRQGIKGEHGSEWEQWYQRFRKAGAQTGWTSHYKDIEARRKKLQRELNMRDNDFWHKSLRGMKSILEVIERENMAVENAVRLSLFRHLIEDINVSEQKAMSIAKNLTVNFNRKGMAGPTINALYLFYNAGIQGSARMMTAVVRSPGVRRLVAGTVIAAAMWDMACRLIMGVDDDDENRYDKIPEWVKERNIIIPNPAKTGDYFKIPMPWGYNVFHVMGQVIGETLSHGMGMMPKKFTVMDKASRLVSAVLSSFNPLGGEGSIAQVIAPTVVDPYIQWKTNENFAGQPLRPEQQPFDVPKPEYQMYWSSAREPSKWATRKLYELTNDPGEKPGGINVSPELFDLIIDNATGSLGRTIGQGVALPWKLHTRAEIKAKEIPIVRRFYGGKSEYFLRTDFYDNLAKIRYAERDIKELLKQGDRKKAKKLRRDKRHILKLGEEWPAKSDGTKSETAKTVRKQLKTLRDQRSKVEASKVPNLAKQTKLKAIEERMNNIMMRFNKKFLKGSDNNKQ